MKKVERKEYLNRNYLNQFHRGAVGEEFCRTGRCLGGRKPDVDDSVCPHLFCIVDHPVDGFLPCIGEHIGVLLEFAPDDALQAGHDILAKMLCTNGVA